MGELLPFLVSGLGVGAVYAMSGVGLVILYRSSGVLNFAFGALGALAAYVAWSLLERDLPQMIVWGSAILTGVVLSVAYGCLVAPRLSHHDSMIRSIGTLGFALILMGFTEWYWGEQPRRLALPTDGGGLDFGEIRLTHTRLLGLILALSMMTGVGLLLARTRIGLQMRALADNCDTSALLGIPVRRIDTMAWALSGAFAGVCGLLLANIVRLQATVLTFLVIPAFAAAILGRLGSLPLTVAGGIVIGMMEALAITVPGIAPFRTATPFVVALIAILSFRNNMRKA